MTAGRLTLEPAGEDIRRVEVSQFRDVRKQRKIPSEPHCRIGLPLDLSKLILGDGARHLRGEAEQILDGPVDSSGGVELTEERLLERAETYGVAKLRDIPPSFFFEALDGRVEQLDRVFH